jgi:hypothetical protein
MYRRWEWHPAGQNQINAEGRQRSLFMGNAGDCSGTKSPALSFEAEAAIADSSTEADG